MCVLVCVCVSQWACLRALCLFVCVRGVHYVCVRAFAFACVCVYACWDFWFKFFVSLLTPCVCCALLFGVSHGVCVCVCLCMCICMYVCVVYVYLYFIVLCHGW